MVDESENFFSVFLSPTDVQTIQKGPVVSKPPAKSQRPEEEVKSTLQESLHTGQSRTTETTESKVKDSSPCVVLKETLAVGTPSPKTEGKHEETVNKECDTKVSTVPLKVSESVITVKTTRENISNMSTQSLTAETKDMALEPKEQKHEDRQSNTPSPPVSTFSSGTSTTSDIEVLDRSFPVWVAFQVDICLTFQVVYFFTSLCRHWLCSSHGFLIGLHRVVMCSTVQKALD